MANFLCSLYYADQHETGEQHKVCLKIANVDPLNLPPCESSTDNY